MSAATDSTPATPRHIYKQNECNLQNFGVVRETAETTTQTHRLSRRRVPGSSSSCSESTVADSSQQHFVRKQVPTPQPHPTLTRRRSYSASSATSSASLGMAGGAANHNAECALSSRGSTTTPSLSARPKHIVATAERIFPSEAGLTFGESETPRRPTSATRASIGGGSTPSEKFARWAVGAVDNNSVAASPAASNVTPQRTGGLRCHPNPNRNEAAAEFQLKDLTGGRQKAAQVPGASAGPFPHTEEGATPNTVRPVIRTKAQCKASGPENTIRPVGRLQRRCADQHHQNTLHFLDFTPSNN